MKKKSPLAVKTLNKKALGTIKYEMSEIVIIQIKKFTSWCFRLNIFLNNIETTTQKYDAKKSDTFLSPLTNFHFPCSLL